MIFSSGGEPQERSGERISNDPHHPTLSAILWRGNTADRWALEMELNF